MRSREAQLNVHARLQQTHPFGKAFVHVAGVVPVMQPLFPHERNWRGLSQWSIKLHYEVHFIHPLCMLMRAEPISFNLQVSETRVCSAL